MPNEDEALRAALDALPVEHGMRLRLEAEQSDNAERHGVMLLGRALLAARERDGLAREVRACRMVRDALSIPRDCIPFVHYDKARAANEAQGWPSGQTP